MSQPTVRIDPSPLIMESSASGTGGVKGVQQIAPMPPQPSPTVQVGQPQTATRQ